MEARASGDSAHGSSAACESGTRRLSTAQHRLARRRLAAALICAPVPFWTKRANHRPAAPQPDTRIQWQLQVNGTDRKDVEDQMRCIPTHLGSVIGFAFDIVGACFVYLHSPWSAYERTFTSKIAPMLGAPNKNPAEAGFCYRF